MSVSMRPVRLPCGDKIASVIKGIGVPESSSGAHLLS